MAIPHHVNRLVTTILQVNPPYYYGINKALVSLELKEMQHLEDYLVFCIGQGLSIDYLADSYLTVMADVLRESMPRKKPIFLLPPVSMSL